MVHICPLSTRRLHTIFVALALSTCASCADGPPSCRLSADCPAARVCVRNLCVSPLSSSPQASPSPTPAQSPCPDALEPDAQTLILNEVLASVPAELPWGDANGDGVRDVRSDEFMEWVNVSPRWLDLSQVTAFKDDDPKPFWSPQTPCLAPGTALVAFAGPTPGHTPPSVPGAVVEVADQPWALRNSGFDLRVLGANGEPIVDVRMPGTEGASVVRWPELDPDGSFEPHHRRAQGQPHSVGACIDGAPLATGCNGPAVACPDRARTEHLVINEALAAVPGGLQGDANGDGVRSASDDEFVEIVNVAPYPVDITAVALWKDQTRRTGLGVSCLEPAQALVIFGALDSPSQPPEGSLFVASQGPLGFNNDGATLTLVNDDDGAVLASAVLPASEGQSLRRAVELDPTTPMVPHIQAEGSARFSPGTCSNGEPFHTGCLEP